MKTKGKMMAWILSGILAAGAFGPVTSLAGQRRGGGAAQGTQAAGQTPQRLRDGSCATPGATQTRSGAAAQKGKTYGPGDGSGFQGTGPKDGTGYGAPSKP